MAYSRVVKVTGAVRGTSTDIPNVVGFSITTTVDFVTGPIADGALGPTVVDGTGFNVTGEIRVSDYTQASALKGHTAEILKLDYQVQGGTSRRRTLDKVQFLDQQPLRIDSRTSQNATSPVYAVAFRGVIGASDTQLSDFMSVGNPV